MTKAQSLLTEYVQNRSEEAFGRLMRSYVDLVYSTAMRLVHGDSHLAEDVAQTVFLHLAKKADRLPKDVALGGWLHRDTCFIAASMLRAERRRQLRERHAAELTMETNESTVFSEIAPVLDEAINQLGEEDRKAVLLRFYERLDLRAVGEQLGSSENAAQKRVSRALDQLHSILIQRGIGATLSAAALGAALAARAVEAAPAEVVASLAKAGLAGAAAGHGTVMTLLRRMTASKASLGVASAVVLIGASWLAWSLLWPSKPPPLALNGAWNRLNKPQPPGHVVRPSAITLDPDGQLYVADLEYGGRIQKRDRDGNWSLVASAEQSRGDLKRWIISMVVDGFGSLYAVTVEPGGIQKRDAAGHWTNLPTASAELGKFPDPRALAIDRAGNLYLSRNCPETGCAIALRKPDGKWVRLADRGNAVGEVTGPWLSPIAADGEGNLYVSDNAANRIQKRDATGRWSVVEGYQTTIELLERPGAIAVDADGALIVAVGPQNNRRLLKRSANGQWNELAVPGVQPGQFDVLTGLSIDSTGALYVAEDTNDQIEKCDANGTWTVVCEALKEPGVLTHAFRIAVDSRGTLYVSDAHQKRVHQRDPQGRWAVVADGVNQPEVFRTPGSPAVDREGNLYVADWELSRVMVRDSHGEWDVCVPPGAGIGQTMRPACLSVDASDSLYVIDKGWPPSRLQRRDRRGQWSVLADSGTNPDSQLGLTNLSAVAAAPDGSIYVAGEGGIRMLDAKRRWNTVAVSGRELGQVGTVPTLATDSFGRLYVVDPDRSRLQVRDVDGKWRILSAPIAAGRSEFWPKSPLGVAVDSRGVVYVTANTPPRVLRWTPQVEGKKAALVSTETKK